MTLEFTNTDSSGSVATTALHLVVDGERVTLTPDSDGCIDPDDDAVRAAALELPGIQRVEECGHLMDNGKRCPRPADECPYDSHREATPDALPSGGSDTESGGEESDDSDDSDASDGVPASSDN